MDTAGENLGSKKFQSKKVLKFSLYSRQSSFLDDLRSPVAQLNMTMKEESIENNTENRGKPLLLVLPLTWMALMRYLSSDQMNGESTSLFVGPFLHWAFPAWVHWQIEFGHYLVRKSAHVTEYAILCCLWIRCLGMWMLKNKSVSQRYLSSTRKNGPRIFEWSVREIRVVIYLSICICLGYAFIDELLQKGTLTRGGSIFDVGFDCFGILTAAVIVLVVKKLKTFIFSLNVPYKQFAKFFVSGFGKK